MYKRQAYILAIGTVSDKGTIDEIGRALDIPLDEVAHIKEMYSAYKDTIESTGKRIKDVYKRQHPSFIKLFSHFFIS